MMPASRSVSRPPMTRALDGRADAVVRLEVPHVGDETGELLCSAGLAHEARAELRGPIHGVVIDQAGEDDRGCTLMPLPRGREDVEARAVAETHVDHEPVPSATELLRRVADRLRDAAGAILSKQDRKRALHQHFIIHDEKREDPHDGAA